MFNFKKAVAPTTSILALSLLVLTGCSTDNNAASESSPSVSSATSSSAASSSTENQKLSFQQTWVKAGNGEMTAAFGEVTNKSKEAVKIVSAESNVTDTVELHATELDPATGTSSMKQTDSFTIKPGETFKLEPGGNHIMFMNMKCSIPAGNTVSVTLKDDQSNSYNFEGKARDYSGAKEEYAPGKESSAASEEHKDMDHSKHGSSESAEAEATTMPVCAQ